MGGGGGGGVEKRPEHACIVDPFTGFINTRLNSSKYTCTVQSLLAVEHLDFGTFGEESGTKHTPGLFVSMLPWIK